MCMLDSLWGLCRPSYPSFWGEGLWWPSELIYLSLCFVCGIRLLAHIAHCYGRYCIMSGYCKTKGISLPCLCFRFSLFACCIGLYIYRCFAVLKINWIITCEDNKQLRWFWDSFARGHQFGEFVRQFGEFVLTRGTNLVSSCANESQNQRNCLLSSHVIIQLVFNTAKQQYIYSKQTKKSGNKDTIIKFLLSCNIRSLCNTAHSNERYVPITGYRRQNTRINILIHSVTTCFYILNVSKGYSKIIALYIMPHSCV